jgi:excisionase family DNA binding protein
VKDDMQRLTFDASEVAALFGIAPVTVYRAVAHGDLNAIRLRGRLLFPRAEILGLLRVHEATPNVSPEGARTPLQPAAA